MASFWLSRLVLRDPRCVAQGSRGRQTASARNIFFAPWLDLAFGIRNEGLHRSVAQRLQLAFKRFAGTAEAPSAV
jgi:hypothetical protein